MSWPVKLTLLAVLVIAGCALISQALLNPKVIRELRTEPNGERASKVMLIDLPSGKSIPVNYLWDGGEFVFAAADFPWWKELRGEGAAVAVLIRGDLRRGHARAIEDDPSRRERIFARLRPTAPLYFGTLIEIRLDDAPPVKEGSEEPR